MIETHHVEHLERVPKPIDPPGVAGLGHHIPTVDGIAPKLAGRAEIIGRNAGNVDRTAVRVELEQLDKRRRSDPEAGQMSLLPSQARDTRGKP